MTASKAIVRGFSSAPLYLRLARWGAVGVWRSRGRFELRSWIWGDRGRRHLVARELAGVAGTLQAAIAAARRLSRGAGSQGPRRNPALGGAVAARARWTGRRPSEVVRGRDTAVLAAPGGVLVQLGELMAVEYAETKAMDGPTRGVYRHELGEEGGRRPQLVADGYGRLRVLGGDYTIEADGIHD